MKRRRASRCGQRGARDRVFAPAPVAHENILSIRRLHRALVEPVPREASQDVSTQIEQHDVAAVLDDDPVRWKPADRSAVRPTAAAGGNDSEQGQRCFAHQRDDAPPRADAPPVKRRQV
jgi:hypothetical protein